MVAASRPVGRRALGASVLACALTSSLGQSSCVPSVLGQYSATGWPEKLDWGIYWFGHDDQFAKATSSQASAFYDPKKPTLLFMHGWTGGTKEGQGWTVNCRRVTTRCPSSACTEANEGIMLAETWLDQGWNVGFFYWDQLADEPCPRHAEQKIWFDRKGDGLRWKSYSVSKGSSTFHHLMEDNVLSVADLCVKAVRNAMAGFSGKHVRFAGHSIGSQLAVRCAGFLHEENHEAAPQRIALLEPFFTKRELLFFFNTPGCQDTTSAEPVKGFAEKATAAELAKLWKSHNVVTEVYKSSILTQQEEVFGKKIEAGTSSSELEKLGTFVRYRPHWCGGLEWVPAKLDLSHYGHMWCRHLAAFPMYFLSMGRPPPPVRAQLSDAPGDAVAACLTPSATCDDESIRMWVMRQQCLNGTAQRWTQIEGFETLNNSDDTFELTPPLLESELVLTPTLASVGCSGGQADPQSSGVVVGMSSSSGNPSPSDSSSPEDDSAVESAWYEQPLNVVLAVVAAFLLLGSAFLLLLATVHPKSLGSKHLEEESDTEAGSQSVRQAILHAEEGAGE